MRSQYKCCDLKKTISNTNEMMILKMERKRNGDTNFEYRHTMCLCHLLINWFSEFKLLYADCTGIVFAFDPAVFQNNESSPPDPFYYSLAIFHFGSSMIFLSSSHFFCTMLYKPICVKIYSCFHGLGIYFTLFSIKLKLRSIHFAHPSIHPTVQSSIYSFKFSPVKLL